MFSVKTDIVHVSKNLNFFHIQTFSGQVVFAAGGFLSNGAWLSQVTIYLFSFFTSADLKEN